MMNPVRMRLGSSHPEKTENKSMAFPAGFEPEPVVLARIPAPIRIPESRSAGRTLKDSTCVS